MDYKTATDFEHLLESMYKCQKGVMWKESVSSYSLNGLERTLALEKELAAGTYKPRQTKVIQITHPKPRDAVSIPFRDRVYQRSLNDNIVYPAMAKGLIYDNGACQKGKGIDFQRNRIRCALQQYYRKHGLAGWVLQCDIAKYYNSIDHRKAEAILEEKLDDVTFEKVCAILRHQYSGERGYNPGSQMVQIIGISLLNKVDHAAKERRGSKPYWRYVDDFIEICPDRLSLELHRAQIERELAEYGLALHSRKTKIYKLEDGIETLGFIFRLTGTGKVVMTPIGKKIKDAKRKYRRMAKRVSAGTMDRETVDQSWECFISGLKRGDTFKLRQRLDEFYKNLWRNGDAQT